MGSLPDPAIYQTGMEPCNHVTCKSSTLSTSSGESTSHMATQGSPSLAQQKKSRIPRYMSPSVPSAKSIIPPNKIKQNSVQSKVKQPVQPWGRAPNRFTYKTSEKQQTGVASCKTSPPISVKPTSTLSSPESPEVSLESQSCSSSVVASEPPAQINALPEVPINNAPSSPGSGVYGTMKPLATSTPAKTTGRKESTRRERSTRFVSDARKIKRMVTGIAPLDAAVDCASAPEWQDRLQATPSTPTFKSSRSYEIEATCVPRPQELHITRRVGVDGVVIAWAPLEHDCVAGFQVLVGGRVVQHVRSPHRTKALVTGLPLAGTFTIGLVTIANDGRCSTPVLVTQDRTRIYAAKRPPKMLRRAVPTAL